MCKIRICNLKLPATCPEQRAVVNLDRDEVSIAFGSYDTINLCHYQTDSCKYGVCVPVEEKNEKAD